MRRAIDLNVYGGLNYDRKRLVNDIAGINAGNRSVEVWSVLLSGDRIDSYLGGGLTQFNLAVGLGQLDIRNAADLAVDSAGPRASGAFTKLAWGGSRLQKLTQTSGLYLGVYGQLANKNLDASEKFYLGGPNGIRAYPVTEGAGDEGWIVTAELRHSLSERMQLLGFVDHGEVRVNKTTWANWNSINPNRPLRYSLSGGGVGISFGKPRDYLVRGIIAFPFGSNPGRDARGNDSDGRSDAFRVWLQFAKFF